MKVLDENQILIFGDPHGHFEHVGDLVHTYKPEAIIFAGDLQPKEHLHKILGDIDRMSQCWFIHGNHDADTELQERLIFKSPWSCRNLNGKVITLPSGIKLSGVGGVFRGEVWMPPGEPNFTSWTHYAKQRKNRANFEMKQRRHRTTIFPNVIKKLSSLKTDVLITHEAPSLHEMGFKILDELALNMEVSYFIHGHHHAHFEYQYEHYKSFGVPDKKAINLSGRVLE